jgi:hypothetical protein
MLDGFSGGISVGAVLPELGLEITPEDYKVLKKAFEKGGGVDTGKGGWVVSVKTKGSKARLQLTANGGKCFFNVMGNPISFHSGQNVMGGVHLSKQVEDFFLGIEEGLKVEFSEKVRKKISELEIFVHHLSFACYTQKIPVARRKALEGVINAWASIFHQGMVVNGEVELAADMLGMKVVKEGALSVRFEKRFHGDGVSRFYSLAVYNKNQELEDTDKDWQVRGDLENRLRLDLTLHRRWLAYYRLNTLADIHRKYGLDYQGWVESLFRRAVEELKLIYVFDPVRVWDTGVGKEGSTVRGEYEKWWAGALGKKPSAGFVAAGAALGVDVTVPALFYKMTYFALAQLGVREKALDRWLVKGDVEALVADLQRGDQAIRLGKISHLLLPDFDLTFPVEEDVGV